MSRKLIPLTKDITSSESFGAARGRQVAPLSSKSKERPLGEKVKALVSRLSGTNPVVKEKSETLSTTNKGPKDSTTNVIGII